MKPILYSPTETAFDTNGLGILSDAISAPVVQELNGQYELILKYPVTGIHAEAIADRCIIVTKPDPVTDPQPFRIYRINPVSKGTITVYARHLAHDTMGIPVAPFSAASAADALVSMKNNAVVTCPFAFSTDKSVAATMNATIPKSLWKTMGGSQGSILDVYGGEYEFDCYNIHLHTRRGADRGVSIRYGKNLKSLEQDRNCANVYTGVYPYWASLDGTLVQLPEKIIEAEGDYNFVRIATVDFTADFLEPPTEEQLRSHTEKYMKDNDIGIPEVSWKVEFIQLEQTEEYKGKALLERVLLGDTVTVIFPQMQVNTSARAVKIEYDSILERYNSITLGKVKSNLADTIIKQKQEIEKKPGTSLVQHIATQLSESITGAKGGAVRLLDTNGDGLPDELYIADNPDPAAAQKVWRYNYEGWAASKNGYNGPFEYGATLNDGLLASFVTAANLIAGTIQSKDGESFFADLDTGEVRIKSVQDISNDLGEYKKTVTTDMFSIAEGLELSISEEVNQSMAEMGGTLQEQINEITTNYRFTADGQYIGRADAEAVLRLTAGIVEVLVAGAATSVFDRTGMTAEQANIKTLRMGDCTWSLGNDGHLTLS